MSDYATVLARRNLAHNPKPANTTHFSTTGGTVTFVTDKSFSGLGSVFYDNPGGGALHIAAAADNDPDLALSGGTLYGKVRVAGPMAASWTVRIRADYTAASGGGTDSTSGINVQVTGGSFETIDLGELTLNPDRVVQSITIRFLFGGVSSFYVGGIDLSYNQAVDAFIQGDAGDGYAWEGAANNSPSTRQAFVATPVFGTGGQYTPTLSAEVISRQGQTLRDITQHLIDGSITYDLDADQHKGTCTITLDEPGLIEPLGDEWLKLSLRVDRPDGTTEEGPLGVFILEPPKETWTEGADQWVYPGKDITALLGTTFIRGVPVTLTLPKDETDVALLPSFIVQDGRSYQEAIRILLVDHMGLRTNQFAFSALPQFFEDDLGFEPSETILNILTGIVEGAGFMKPWATPPGIITSERAGVNPATVSPSIILSTGNNSRVRWPFEVDMDVGAIGNRVRVISAQDVTSVTTRRKKVKGKWKTITERKKERHVVEVWRMNNDPSHPLSFPRLGRWMDIPDVLQPLVQTQTEATAIADQALIDGGQLPVRVRLVTEAMVRGLNEVYELDLKDHYGNPIESGQGRYWCKGWSMQLGLPWEMVHNLSRTIDFAAASFVSE